MDWQDFECGSPKCTLVPAVVAFVVWAFLADDQDVASIAQAAVDDVLDGLREAVNRNDGVCWVSMPGGIALYGLNNRNGVPASFYRLYSTQSPWVRSLSDTEADIPEDWNQQTTRFVDLNGPIGQADRIPFPTRKLIWEIRRRAFPTPRR